MAEDGLEFEQGLSAVLHRGFGGNARSQGARWLTDHEMQGGEWQADGGLLLGKRRGRLIGWKDDRHMLTVAGTRAGKGVSLVIPNMLMWGKGAKVGGGALVIDPKGELARVTANRRGHGSKQVKEGLGRPVYILDPFDTTAAKLTGLAKARFNPLAAIKPESENAIDDAGMFAEALIVPPPEGEQHWAESAQGVLRGLILMVLNDPDPKRRNLLTVRRLLMLTDEAVRDELAKWKPKDQMTEQKCLIALLKREGLSERPNGDVCAGVGQHLAEMGEEELPSVLSNARTQTQWLDSPALRPVLGFSDLPTFDLADLKTKGATVYLCLPSARMGTHSRWLRLMISLALTTMERTDTTAPLDAPVLFVLDEFAILGRMKSLVDAAAQMAGFGVKLWPIIQNVGQLEEHYGKNGWSTFVGNCGMVTAFGNSDHQTLHELSSKLGRTELYSREPKARTVEEQMRNEGFRRPNDIPLLDEQEIRLAFGKRGRERKWEQRILLLATEHEPAAAQRLEYFRDPVFAGLFDDDPKRGR